VETLEMLGRRFGFKVHVTRPVKIAGERIASHRIRQEIQAGRLKKAALALGRPVTVVGVCVPGSGRGRKLGFPTANLRLEAGVPPPVGVYAVRVKMSSSRKRSSRTRGSTDSRFRRNDKLLGMANIGFRPTFGKVKGPPLLEIHLFGLRRALYGRRLEVAFHKRLRPERRFPSAKALKAQLESDARRARRFFALQSKSRVV